MSKANKLRKKTDKWCYNNYLSLFNEYPTPSLAYSVFTYARKCEIKIPEKVLEMITPAIEKLHKNNLKKIVEKSEKHAEADILDTTLLHCVIEAENIQLGIDNYCENNPTDTISYDGYRKRLKKILKARIDKIVEHTSDDLWGYFPKPDLNELTTEQMIKFYKEIVFITES